MFHNGFDDKLKEYGCRVQQVAYRAPNQNAFVERFVQSIKQELLDNFIVFGEDHYNYLIAQWLDHYHTTRPRQGLDNKLVVHVPAVEAPLDTAPGKSGGVEVLILSPPKPASSRSPRSISPSTLDGQPPRANLG